MPWRERAFVILFIFANYLNWQIGQDVNIITGMYEAGVTHSFKARHALRLVDGTNEDSHEHTWRMTACFRSEMLDEPMGVVIDFIEVKNVLKEIADKLEGTDLNALEAFLKAGPSAERLAEFISGLLAKKLKHGNLLHCLRITEAPGCEAAFYPQS